MSSALSSLAQVLALGCCSKAFYELSNQTCTEKFSHLCCYSDNFLRKFTTLTELEVAINSEITDASLSVLTSLEKLRIYVDDTKTFTSLSCLTNLRKLFVGHSFSSTLPELHLSLLTNLVSLNIPQLPADVEDGLPNLRSLVLTTDHTIHDWGLWTNLTKLDVDESSITDEGLTKMTNLVSLGLHPEYLNTNAVLKLTGLTALDFGEPLR